MNGNGTGRTGKSFQDRQLAAEVRRLTLEQIKAILTGQHEIKDLDFKKAIILKLAGTVLPRLNEHSGPEGEPLALFNYVQAGNNNSSPEDTKAQ